MEQKANANSSFATIFQGLLDDLRALLRQELQLALHEVQAELSKAKTAGTSMVAGIGLATVGTLFLLLMVVHGLTALGLPLWASYGIIGALLVVAGAVLLIRARKTMSAMHVVPPMTVETIKATVTWLKEHATKSARESPGR